MRYMICFIPRTGSNALCDYLAQTKLAGFKDVFTAGLFIGYGELTADRYANGDVDIYFDSVRTDNGVEGCKLGFDYLDMLDNHLPYCEVDKILASFERHIYLYREDKVAQAVSWFIARRTGIWSSHDGQNKEPRPVEFNYDRLAYFLGRIRASEARFESYFIEHGIEPLVMSYEENAADWEGAVERVCAFIDVDWHRGDTKFQPRLKRQTDKRKAQYIKRYMEEWARRNEVENF